MPLGRDRKIQRPPSCSSVKNRSVDTSLAEPQLIDSIRFCLRPASRESFRSGGVYQLSSSIKSLHGHQKCVSLATTTVSGCRFWAVGLLATVIKLACSVADSSASLRGPIRRAMTLESALTSRTSGPRVEAPECPF